MQSKQKRRFNLVLMIIAICLTITAGPVSFTYANADPGTDDKTVNTEESKDKTKTEENKKKESADKNADTDTTDNKSAVANAEDIIEENANAHGNASLGDAVKTSGQMDFYTIRTANNQTYYLVVDHSGAVDNVYLLSTIDANDLEDFVDSGAARNGGIVTLPDTRKDSGEDSSDDEVSASDTKDQEKGNSNSATKNSRNAGLVSLAVILAAGGVGAAAYMRSRKRSKEVNDYANENLEYDDGLPRVIDDDDL